MHLVSYPGLALTGILVAGKHSGYHSDRTSIILCVSITTILLLSILIARILTNHAGKALFMGIATGLLIPAGAMAAGWHQINTDTIYLGAFTACITVYTAIAWYYLSATEKKRYAGQGRWIPLILVFLLTCTLVVDALFFTNKHSGIKAWCVYLLVWTIFRTFYFCNALKGVPARPLTEQAYSELLKGSILIQATAIACLVDGPMFIISPVLTLVVMTLSGWLGPWKIRKTKYTAGS